jgi:hypothetical protein
MSLFNMAVDGVCCEPVSGIISLLTGILQGIFAFFPAYPEPDRQQFIVIPVILSVIRMAQNFITGNYQGIGRWR